MHSHHRSYIPCLSISTSQKSLMIRFPLPLYLILSLSPIPLADYRHCQLFVFPVSLPLQIRELRSHICPHTHHRRIHKQVPPGCVALLTLLESHASAHHAANTLIAMPSYTDLRQSSLSPFHNANANGTTPKGNRVKTSQPTTSLLLLLLGVGVPINNTLCTPLSRRADGRKQPRHSQRRTERDAASLRWRQCRRSAAWDNKAAAMPAVAMPMPIMRGRGESARGGDRRRRRRRRSGEGRWRRGRGRLVAKGRETCI